LSRNRKKNRSSRSHRNKTREEKKEYGKKIKLAESEGQTKQAPKDLSSTQATPSAFTVSHNTGIPDRTPIRPPKDDARWTIGKISSIVGILTFFGGCIYWFATLNSRVGFNEKQISTLETSVDSIDSKREDLSRRISQLENWKEMFSEDLKKVKEDITKGISIDQIELKLIDLESRIMTRIEANRDK